MYVNTLHLNSGICDRISNFIDISNWLETEILVSHEVAKSRYEKLWDRTESLNLQAWQGLEIEEYNVYLFTSWNTNMFVVSTPVQDSIQW